MAKASRKLLLALFAIAVALALVVGGTYALFSAQVNVENHLFAGNLSAKLVRENLETVSLAENGRLTKTTDSAEKDFTKATSENLFGLTDGTKIAPGCKFTASMVLTNDGSVAFSYWIEVKLKSESNKLAEQLKVTVKAGETENGQALSTSLTVGSDEEGLGVVEVGQTAKFSVTVEFTNVDGNNEAMSQEAEFDFIVHAIQDVSLAE